MPTLSKGIKEITNTNNRRLSVLCRASCKKFNRFFVWYFVVVWLVCIIMPRAVQAFSLEKECQGSEIEVRSLYFNVISTEDFVNGLFVEPPPNVMTVCEKEKPEFVSCVDILVPSSYKKAETNADQSTDDAGKSANGYQYSVWWILFHVLAFFAAGSVIGGALAFWLFTLLFPSNADILVPSNQDYLVPYR